MKFRSMCTATAILAALAIIQPAAAKPAKIHVNDLFAVLTKDKVEKKLTGQDLKRYPKLAAIVVGPDLKTAITSDELIQRIGAHVVAYKKIFSAIDINRDGRISPLEFAQRAPRLLVYFPYLDLNNDGGVTLSELLSSRVFLQLSNAQQGHGKSGLSAPVWVNNPESISKDQSAQNREEVRTSDGWSGSLLGWEASESLLLSAFFHKDSQKDGEPPQRVDEVVVTGSRFIDDDWEIADWGYDLFPAPGPDECIDSQCVDPKAKCDADYAGDIALCNMMYPPASATRTLCYGLAFVSYSNCLRGE